jgi:hypothetical protein
MLREVRVLVRDGATLRRLCKLALSAGDASLYLFPYAPTNTFLVGESGMAADEMQREIPFPGAAVIDPPKLSIHESGQVHVQRGTTMLAGPMSIPPLADLRGEHIATVTADAFSILPPYTRQPRTTGPTYDLVTAPEPGVISGRIAVYINGSNADFPVEGATLVLQRPTITAPLYVLLAPLAQTPLAEDGIARGISVIGGWNPRSTGSDPTRFLVVRGT